MRSESELPGKHPPALVAPQHGLVWGTVVVLGVSYQGQGVAETPAALSAGVHTAICRDYLSQLRGEKESSVR